VLTDMSGPYSAMGGQGSVVAAKMAVEDCLKNECKGMKIEILSADNQNKPDVGVTRAREWLDRDKVEAIADLTNSSVALAVQKLIKEKGGIAMYSGPATGALTTAECATNGFHWMFDTYSQAAGAPRR
jgi:branched-chain amino acid transport system substrate-binding protein